MVLLVALAVLLPAVFVVELFRPVPRRYVDRFLRRYPVRMTTTNGPMVLRRLARVRTARTLGGLAGAVTGAAFSLLGSSFNLLAAIALGYLVGAVVAEVPTRRERAAARGAAASLVPRRLGEYVPRGLVLAPVVVTVFTAVIEVAAALGAYRPHPAHNTAWRGAALVGAMAIACVVTLVAARTILYRPQPYTTPEMMSADDALRASSLHCVCGGGFAIVAVLASTALWNVASRSDVEPLRWVAGWLGLTLMLVAYYAWFGLRVSPWFVRRSYVASVVAQS